MIKSIWNLIDKQNWEQNVKLRCTLLLLSALYSLIGLAARLIIRIWAFSTWDWFFCFIGYPVVISWFVVILYSCNHHFHD